MKYIIFYYILLVNLVGFFMMYIDKKRAINNQWRVKESTLLLIAIIGGSLGSLVGMYNFRHKTKHIKFIYGIPFIILIQLVLCFSIII